MAIILASASPRRRDLLAQTGCQFSVVTSDVVEDNTQDMPSTELAVYQAKAKAMAVAGKADPRDFVIGADTIVVFRDNVYGKPKDSHDAKRMLSDLSGNEHDVITGIAVVHGKNAWTDYVVTKVRFAALSADEIDRYVHTGEPMDKAGAYAIQGIGALMVEEIYGCYSNVVGLPLRRLSMLLQKAGTNLL